MQNTFLRIAEGLRRQAEAFTLLAHQCEAGDGTGKIAEWQPTEVAKKKRRKLYVLSYSANTLLKQSGYSTAWLADHTGIHISMLYRYFNRQQRIPEERLEKIAKALRVSPKDIRGRNRTKPIQS